jgi:hypothetical protein
MAGTVSLDINPLINRLDALKLVQVPFATSLALNAVAKDVKEAEREEMKRVFDNPVPFTLNSVRIKKYSTKKDLSVRLEISDDGPKGNAPADYLLPVIKGGNAYATRFQKSLRAKGVLRAGQFAIPTQSDFLKTNKYGNVRPSMYSDILSDQQAYRSARSSGDLSVKQIIKAGRRSKYRMISTQLSESMKYGGLQPGIYFNSPKAYENNEALLFSISNSPPVVPLKFKFQEVGKAAANKNLNKRFGQALGKAIATGF